MARRALLFLSLVALSLSPLLAGCPPINEASTPANCDGQPVIFAMLVSSELDNEPPITSGVDVLGFLYTRFYPDLNTVSVEEITERIEVRNSEDDLICMNEVFGTGSSVGLGLQCDEALSVGDYTVTLTLDADVQLTSCLAIYVVTTLTESFTVVDPEPDPDPDPDPDPEPDPDPVNEFPIADAGPDKNVIIGRVSLLDGTSSTDPEGESLTFDWTQTGGTTVDLQNSDTANPVFTAPLNVETLIFQLAVEDEAGNESTDSVNVNVILNTQLYVVGGNDNSVVAHDLDGYDDMDGNASSDARLFGASTDLNSPLDAVLNLDGELMVVNVDSPSVTVYADATSITNIDGNVAPLRTVEGNETLLASPISLAYDPDNDLLFVGDEGNNSIHVFAGASTAAFSGDVAPVRSIFIDGFFLASPRSLCLAGSGDLYVVDDFSNDILVYANAATLDGLNPPDRVIESADFDNISALTLSSDDRLYVTDRTGGRVFMFDNASTLNGNVNPDATLTVPGAAELTDIVIGPLGHGLILDRIANAIYDYEDMATLSGSIPPDRTLQGPNTQLIGPDHLLLNAP